MENPIWRCVCVYVPTNKSAAVMSYVFASVPKRFPMVHRTTAFHDWCRSRLRSIQCMEYLDGIPVATMANDTSCWEQLEELVNLVELSQRSCRNIPCLAMYLDVRARP